MSAMNSTDPAAAAAAAAAAQGQMHLPPMVQTKAVYGGRGPAFLGVAYGGLILATFLIGCRLVLYRRRAATSDKMLTASLWLALLSWACATAGTVLLTVAIAHGFGNHTMNLSLPNIIVAQKYLWIGISLATFSTGTSKGALAAFLLAMQGKSTYHRKGAYFLWFMAISNILLNFLAMFTIIYQCNPPEAAWDPRITGANCYDREHLFGPVALTHASWTAFSDLALATYPVWIVYKLQVPVNIKISLCVIMGLGVVGGIFSFVKLHLLDELVKHTPTDPMYQIPILAIWGWVELWLVLLALSVPPIWPMIRPVLDRLSIYSGGSQMRSSRGTKASYVRQIELESSRNESGIKQTKDIIVLTESGSGRSTKSLCSQHHMQEKV